MRLKLILLLNIEHLAKGEAKRSKRSSVGTHLIEIAIDGPQLEKQTAMVVAQMPVPSSLSASDK